MGDLIVGARYAGADGADKLVGFNGGDTLRGGLGFDRLTGGNGADKIVFDVAPAFANRDLITDFQYRRRHRAPPPFAPSAMVLLMDGS